LRTFTSKYNTKPGASKGGIFVQTALNSLTCVHILIISPRVISQSPVRKEKGKEGRGGMRVAERGERDVRGSRGCWREQQSNG
jgi:hypothetical protein